MSDQSQTTVLDALAGRLAADPDGPYLDFDGVALSAGEMDEAANRSIESLEQQRDRELMGLLKARAAA